MLTPGDVVELDLGAPAGSKAGMTRPAVVVTAARVLRGGPHVVQVIPLTRTIRDSGAEVVIEPDEHNGLSDTSAAQCQHIRTVSTARVSDHLGTIGPSALGQVRDTLAALLDV
ncbi:MAG TPA: type II toxin-antitoxin system PemK/MazF family toxin [Beutenbergiaceae bacterium]|nr:type II toxin-antitoxin system PemK/MazF family toxin [Beutenbergiaceae bacterium]